MRIKKLTIYETLYLGPVKKFIISQFKNINFYKLSKQKKNTNLKRT